jgi:hypothetical protein
MSTLIRRIAVATFAALISAPFTSSVAVAAPAPTEPDTYTLSSGASVDRTTVSHDRDFANRAALPPPCITARLDHRGLISQAIHVRNDCAAQHRIKVIVAFGFDSPCFILDPGASVAHAMDTSIPRAYFDGLESC